MIITTWIVYIFTRKGVGLPFPPKANSDIEVVESEAVSVVQHWLNKGKEEERGPGQRSDEAPALHPFTFTFQTEEEASRNIKEKMSTNIPPTHGHDIHVTRDLVTESLWGSGAYLTSGVTHTMTQASELLAQNAKVRRATATPLQTEPED
ncbi:hypothetical protein U0070_012411 [Myodes glareolus]|uniref:Uncharacterized protein n=1 Tax=Myodes glareolus TaxID=447135 RepID=A0AAW0IE00_MYOGA